MHCCLYSSCDYCALFTAGLPDMAMSALVKEQIEGIRSEAISIIPPDKFAVSQFAVFSKVIMSLFQLACMDLNEFPNSAALSAVLLFLKVVFDQRQISMFSYEQAAAVTEEQLSALSDVQRTALAMVLTPWEDRPVDFRGERLIMAVPMFQFAKFNICYVLPVSLYLLQFISINIFT